MKRIIYIILFVAILLTLTALLIANFIANEDFWKATFAQCMPLLLTFFIVFWATQYKNDFRKHKDHAERIIFKLQEIVTNERFYKISKGNDSQNQEREKEIFTNKRKINNYITILKEYARQLKIKEEVDYISKEFTDYNEFIGDHIKDFDYLEKSEKELLKHSENIDTKCEFIILKIYK
ncbi:flagellar motor protein MotB [Ruminococcus champanellensis]